MASLRHPGQALQEIEVGVPAGTLPLVADVGAEFEISALEVAIRSATQHQRDAVVAFEA